MSTALGLVVHGVGVGVLPSSARSMIEQAGLASARLYDPVMKRDIGIVTKRGRSLGPAAQALVEALGAIVRGGAGKMRQRK